jgi:hypothetical protein
MAIADVGQVLDVPADLIGPCLEELAMPPIPWMPAWSWWMKPRFWPAARTTRLRRLLLVLRRRG